MQQAKNPILIAFVSNGMPYRLDDCSGEDDSKRKRIEFTSIQRVALATSVILAASGLERNKLLSLSNSAMAPS